MRKKTVKKITRKVIAKKTSTKAHSQRERTQKMRTVQTAHRAVPSMITPPATHSAIHASRSFQEVRGILGHARGIFIWSFIAVAAFAVLLVVASYGSGSEGSSFEAKLPQTSTLNLLRTDDPVTVFATGDILLARYVEQNMRTKKDYTFPFLKVADLLKSGDITLGNLETPFFPGRTTPTGSMTFRADLESVAGLSAAGFDVVSIANNHVMNYQVPGLTTTLQTLKQAGILPSGGGRDVDAAHTPALMDVNGRRFAFYSYVDNSIPPRFHGEAKKNTPGIALMDIEAVKNDVRSARESYGADIVVVSMHAGKEYTHTPTQFQRDFAHAAIDAGASAVIGHHPHWTQSVEEYMDGVIFYSLGNFVFDQFFSEEVQTGLIAKIVFDEDEPKPTYELLPVKIEKTQPRILEGEEKAKILTKLGL